MLAVYGNKIEDMKNTYQDMKQLSGVAYPSLVVTYISFILLVFNIRVAICNKNYIEAIKLVQQVTIRMEYIITQFCYPMFILAEGIYELIMLTKAGVTTMSNLSIFLTILEDICYWFWKERALHPHIEGQAWLWCGILWCIEGRLEAAKIAFFKGLKVVQEFELYDEEALMKAIIAPQIFHAEEANKYIKEAEQMFKDNNLKYNLEKYIEKKDYINYCEPRDNTTAVETS